MAALASRQACAVVSASAPCALAGNPCPPDSIDRMLGVIWRSAFQNMVRPEGFEPPTTAFGGQYCKRHDNRN